MSEFFTPQALSQNQLKLNLLRNKSNITVQEKQKCKKKEKRSKTCLNVMYYNERVSFIIQITKKSC